MSAALVHVEPGTADHSIAASQQLSGGNRRNGRVKIAYVTKVFPRLSETFILSEIRELKRQGTEVEVYALRPVPDGEEGSLPEGFTPATVLRPRTPVNWLRLALAHLRTAWRQRFRYGSLLLSTASRWDRARWWRFAEAGYLADTFRRAEVQHVHAHFATGAVRAVQLANRLGGPSFSFTAHAKDIFRHSVNSERLALKVRDASFVVTVSHFNRTHIASQVGDQLTTSKVRVLYNGIDLDWFQPANRRAEPGLILGAGRLVEKKGFVHLVRALSILRKRGVRCHVLLVGEGAERAGLEQECDRLGLGPELVLAGSQPHTVMRDWLSRAAVVCLPCIEGADGNRDALPTVLLEAMALGVPVVSTRLTGVPEIVDHGVTGHLVDPTPAEELPAALADALAEILLRPDRAGRMGQAARQRVERLFDIRRQVGTLNGWFGETISSNGAKGTSMELTA